MEDLLKKLVYTGVGVVSMTAEKLQEAVDKLVDERKMSADEGKKLVDEFFDTTEEKKKEFEGQLSSIVEKIVRSFKFASNKEVSELTDRVKTLEANAGIVGGVEQSEKKAVKKAPSKAKVVTTK
ncbi:hypothetical protein WAF17_00055 [Bernardetia sp. ABR2-2B]|uniref:phasin family protein n=1 Tax=Bernardetia sp. ABR2-2B TaxID=3127472 RepID=UPI0030CEE682